MGGPGNASPMPQPDEDEDNLGQLVAWFASIR